jgi:adenine/guanine phosphoribosyltransferase-like PRPP-binding protein
MSERSEFCIFSKIDYILAWTRQGLIFGYALTEGMKCPWGAFHQGKVTDFWINSVIHTKIPYQTSISSLKIVD